MRPRLVCPACRHVAAGVLHVRELEPPEAPHALIRCACGRNHPVVDGIPVVFRDTDAYLAQETPALLRRRDLPDDVAAHLDARAPDPLARDASLLRTYTASHDGPLQEWLRSRCADLGPRVLELGSGLGVTGRSDVVALDHAFALLREHPSSQRVCADAGDPPFDAASFDAVVLANVLDACADPGLVLAQADALLVPGGTLVVTCAYAFQPTVTPRARWFDSDALEAALFDGAPLAGWQVRPYARVEVARGLRWPLRVGPRTVHEHAADAFVTRKPT